MAGDSGCDLVHVAPVSPEGAPEFIEVDTDDLRNQLAEHLRLGYIALGLLGWDFSDGKTRAMRQPFPWYEDEETVLRIFRRICDDRIGLSVNGTVVEIEEAE